MRLKISLLGMMLIVADKECGADAVRRRFTRPPNGTRSAGNHAGNQTNMIRRKCTSSNVSYA